MLKIKIRSRHWLKTGVWTFALAFLFVGCLGIHTSSSLVPPSWFTTPAQDTRFLYGHGSGKTLEESKQNAINDLALSVRVKINSNTFVTNTQENDNQNSNISQNIRLSLKDISLEGLEFSHNDYKNSQYYSQVKVPKKALAKTLKNQYDTLFFKLRAFDTQACKTLSILDKKILSDLLEEANSLRETIYIVAPSASLDSLVSYNEILKKNSPLPKARLVFSPQGEDDIISAISSEYAKFVKNTSEEDIQIAQNKISIANVKDQIKISLQVDFKDCHNKIFFSFQIESIQDTKEDAIARLKVQLYKKLTDYSSEDKSVIPKLY